MIETFADKHTAAVFTGLVVRRFGDSLTKMMRKKLKMIDAAYRIEDLSVPPDNRLEKLAGDRKRRWSVRVNDQWRICFRFEGGNAKAATLMMWKLPIVTERRSS